MAKVFEMKGDGNRRRTLPAGSAARGAGSAFPQTFSRRTAKGRFLRPRDVEHLDEREEGEPET